MSSNNYNHGRINKDLTLIIYYKFHAKHISSTSLPSRPAAQPFHSDARISFQTLILSPQIKQRDIDGQHRSLFLGINPYELSDLFPFLKGLAFTYKRIITKRQGREAKRQGRIHKKRRRKRQSYLDIKQRCRGK
jgi:hypothetical protein